MPTPRNESTQLQVLDTPYLGHTICPVETERREAHTHSDDARPDSENSISEGVRQQQNMSLAESEVDGTLESVADEAAKSKMIAGEQDYTITEALSPMSINSEAKDAEQPTTPASTSSTFATSSSINYGISNIRMTPNWTSSFFRAGSRFKGTQQSDRQTYNVEVEIKSVDMAESKLCGYLRIEGLTHDHPTLTTFFEGEIIGPKYTFLTRHPSWGATEKTDMQHWGRFPAWRPLAKQAKKADFHYKNSAQRENIFMRWKESFLVPDHRVREITGASFEGFYYICFNQVTGDVSGIYFHARSERFQQLELRHVGDRGCYGAIEFR